MNAEPRSRGSAGLPVPSPDGQLIAYVTFEPQPMRARPDLQFWGRNAKWFNISTETTRWTPDSQFILYIKNEAGVSKIWSQSISGEPPKQITHFNGDVIRRFDLSREGKQLVMNRGTANRDVVLIRDLK